MEKLWALIKGGALGLAIVISGITIFVLVANWLIAAPALGSPPYTTTREATIGQQDRTVTATDIPKYDNSDFLRDMDNIAAGNYKYGPLAPTIEVCKESDTVKALMQQNLYLIRRLAELEAQ